MQCLVSYCRSQPSDVQVLFDMLSVLTVPSPIDYTFLKKFLSQEVAAQWALFAAYLGGRNFQKHQSWTSKELGELEGECFPRRVQTLISPLQPLSLHTSREPQ